MIRNNVILNITPDPMAISIEEGSIIQRNIEQGYSHIVNVDISPEDIQDRLEKIKAEFELEVFDYSTNSLNVTIQAFGPEVILYMKGNNRKVHVSFFTKDNKTSHRMWELLDGVSDEDEIQIRVATLAIVQGRIQQIYKYITKEEIDYVSDEYYPYIDINEMFRQYLSSYESILLLTGEPGLGKSKLAALAMQYSMENPEQIPHPIDLNDPFINLVFVKGIDILGSEEFWMEIEEGTPDFVIIDDLDNMLTTREAEVQTQEDVIKNKFMNQFLSFTDGIEKRRTKFIITTNQNYRDIDPAVMREGRLFDILEMRPLKNSEALEIWKNKGLSEEDFHSKFEGSKTITAARLGTELHRAIGNISSKSYLKEEGISKMDDAKVKRKITI